jgi:hypothetical protein
MAAPGGPEPVVAPETLPGQVPQFLPWLLNTPPLSAEPLSAAEQRALQEIQKMVALPSIPDSMLPRASALVPQLIALLRQADLPLPAVAERVSRDAVLTAELMRLASSPYYRAQGEVGNLLDAITLMGSGGVQRVIARVVLKPIFQGASGLQVPGSAERMWAHSQALARHAAALAESAGQPSFDAYLVGLLHNTGWKVVFGALSQAGIALSHPPSDSFAGRASELAHRLFGHVAHAWAITPAFTTFAADARDKGLAASAHPLAPVLRSAHLQSMTETLSGTS